MLDPVFVYMRYQAIRLHFTSESYDCFKYNFKTRTKAETYYKAKGKQFYGKLSKLFSKVEDLDKYIVSHMIEDKTFIGDMFENDIYKEWQKRNQSLGRVFSLDLEVLKETCERFDDLFDTSDGHPPIIKLLTRKQICIETVVIIDKLVGFIDRVDIKEPLVWPSLKMRLKKYSPFVEIDRDRYRKMLLQVFS